VLELAKDILRDGYLDNELPVVVAENARRVVLEGNRRVTALKAIRSPAFLGASAARMERLLSRYPDADAPAAIRVMVAPSRDAAQQLLARLHTGTPKKSWLREQQAMFYHAQLSPAVGLDELRALYPGENASIASFIRMGEMREVIRALRYGDRELEQFVKTSQLKMTSFEYAYERPGIQAVLGLEFGGDGRLKTKRFSKDQTRGLMYLLAMFKVGTLNTRSPELKAKGSAHDQFVERLRQVVSGEADPGRTQGDYDATETRQPSGAPGSSTGAGHRSRPGGSDAGASSASAGENPGSAGKTAGAGGTATEASRAPNRGATRSRLDMEGFEYKGSSAGMRRRFEELARLDVRDFPNAGYDLLRTVLECAIKDYFAAKGQRLKDKMLSACLQELIRAYRGDQRMTSLINAVNRKGTMPASQYSGTALSLNSGNHEPDSFAGSNEVHEAWERIKPILIEIVGK